MCDERKKKKKHPEWDAQDIVVDHIYDCSDCTWIQFTWMKSCEYVAN